MLRAFRRLAQEHSAASQLGIEVEELRERAAEARISRREFVKRSGAVGAAVAVAGPLALTRPARGAAAPRIAIVGGGIAGLTAALTLQDKGVYADVYESSGRVGGRMHSDWQEFGTGYRDDGQQAELCGELIDGNHKTILQLAQRFGLATADLLQAQPNGTEDTYWIFGADYPYAQASADLAARRAAERRLQRGVRRRDDRPVGAPGRSTAPRTSATTSSAATRSCRSPRGERRRSRSSAPAGTRS